MWFTDYRPSRAAYGTNSTMNYRYSSLRHAFLALLALVACAVAPQVALANDGIFPSAPAAKAAMDFDGRGFLVNGQRTFIASAGLEYARVPHELWRERLLQIKRGGMNCVEIYTFWNFHEPKEGKFDFSGDHDLDAFLKLAHSVGLYVIARVGPYYCAEWDSGGYPNWLRYKQGMLLRQDNPEFEKYVDRFFEKLLPIIAANQINHGGSVILVQLENEHPAGWGTSMPNAYFKHLRDKALSLGLEVPYFFSGLHHSADPAGHVPWDSVGRTNPWFSTEFWVVWYDKYGENASDVKAYDNRTWRIIANGGNGYNYYMYYGGTNFGYTNGHEDRASYDYGSPIGQAGDLRPLYYKFKRAATFARSFSSVLEDSTNTTAAFAGVASDTALKVTARKSRTGTILFLENPTNHAIDTKVADGQGHDLTGATAVAIASGEIAPIVLGYSLAPGIAIASATSRIYSVATTGDVTTVVVCGPSGTAGNVAFDAPNAAPSDTGAYTQSGASLAFHGMFSDTATASHFTVGKQTVRVIAVSDALADRTWFIDGPSGPLVVCGPSYVGDVALDHGKLTFVGTEPASAEGAPAACVAVAFGSGDTPTLLAGAPGESLSAAPKLGGWQTLPAADAALPGFGDSAWLASADPLQMSADGDDSAYAWYRTKLNVPTAGRYTVQFTRAANLVAPFVDGKSITGASNKGFDCDLTAGTHMLAIFTEHYGRDKLFGFTGDLSKADLKGVVGPVTLCNIADIGMAVTDWRVHTVAAGENSAAVPGDDPALWSAVKLGDDVFNKAKGTAWYRAELLASAATTATVRFEDIDDNATVYLNGKKVGEHAGWGKPFDVSLDSAWVPNGKNVLLVRDENIDGAGGITGSVLLTHFTSRVPVNGWKMRGGPGDPLATTGWMPGVAATGDRAAFFRATFTASVPQATGYHPTYRATFAGLSHGSMWINGHNVGRYPETIKIDGLYLPEPWLKNGTNELVVYDDMGKAPTGVAIEIEGAASRYGFTYAAE